jgi:hypothetical protein
MTLEIQIKEKGKNAPVYEIETDFGGTRTLEDLLLFTRNALIAVSDKVLEEEQAKGFDKNPVVIVDNRVGKPVDQVKPLGKIEYKAKISVGVAAIDLMKNIEKRTPKNTGLYASQNLVFFNSVQIASSSEELATWFANPPEFKDGDRLRFLNAAPYAHALERYGVTAQRRKRSTRKSKDEKQRSGSRVLKPNGVYQLSYRSAKRKYKGNIKIKFEILPGQYLGITQPLPPSSRQQFRATYDPKGKFNKGFYMYPSILLDITTQGIVQ